MSAAPTSNVFTWDFIYFPLDSADACPSGRARQTSAIYRNAAKREAATTRCAMPAAGKAICLLDGDFGTSDIVAVVDRECISPVRD
jgi:hypothetical protein